MLGLIPSTNQMITQSIVISHTDSTISPAIIQEAAPSEMMSYSLVPSAQSDLPKFDCCPGLSVAAKPLATNRFSNVIKNEDNDIIMSGIRGALACKTCDPTLKRKIFQNIMLIQSTDQDELARKDEMPVGENYAAEINKIMEEIADRSGSGCLDSISAGLSGSLQV